MARAIIHNRTTRRLTRPRKPLIGTSESGTSTSGYGRSGPARSRGKEPAPSEFSESNNCKDPRWFPEHDEGCQRPSSCQGAGHAILAPARLAVQLPSPTSPPARPPLRRPPAPAARRHPLRQGPPHRHLLVPRRRHHRPTSAPPTPPSGPPAATPRHLALSLLCIAVKPLLRRPGDRLLFAIDDTPTARYGPCVEGAGIHHNPSPGPAGEKFVYGHVWVTLAGLAQHPAWGTLALPLQAQLYVRASDLAKLPPDYRRPFRTKLEWPPSSCAG